MPERLLASSLPPIHCIILAKWLLQLQFPTRCQSEHNIENKCCANHKYWTNSRMKWWQFLLLMLVNQMLFPPSLWYLRQMCEGKHDSASNCPLLNFYATNEKQLFCVWVYRKAGNCGPSDVSEQQLSSSLTTLCAGYACWEQQANIPGAPQLLPTVYRTSHFSTDSSSANTNKGFCKPSWVPLGREKGYKLSK